METQTNMTVRCLQDGTWSSGVVCTGKMFCKAMVQCMEVCRSFIPREPTNQACIPQVVGQPYSVCFISCCHILCDLNLIGFTSHNSTQDQKHVLFRVAYFEMFVKTCHKISQDVLKVYKMDW